MYRVRLLIVVCLALGVNGRGAIASAKTSPTQTESSKDHGEPDYSLEVFVPGSSGGGGGSGGPGPAIDCTWVRATAATDLLEETAIGGAADYFGITRIDENGSAFRSDPDTSDELILYSRFGSDCQNGFIWVPTSLTPRSLIPGLRARIERTLDDPVPNMSPAPEFGTYMNLGIWLAVEDPGVTSDRLTAGPVWASARAVLTGFDVDFGNGDVESCEGVGVPIVDTETFDEGPCGYTYGWPDERGEYDVTFTSHYDVTYVLSNGESGSLAVIDRTTSFPYYVYELQTVGRDN